MKNKYTNKEYIKMYENYKNLCTDMVSKVSNYEGWSSETISSEMSNLYNKIIDEFNGVDFTVFAPEQLFKLGFKEWDDDIILAPIWAADCLTEGTEVYTISNEKETIGPDKLDLDTRMGVTVYGFNKKQLRASKIEGVLED